MSGTLQASVVKDSASATNNLAMDASGNVTVGNNLTVTGTTTHTGTVTNTGNMTVGGTLGVTGATTLSSTLGVTGAITGSSTIADATAILRPLVSGTAQATTSGTSITFSSIPSWVKRITVMFSNVSTNGSSNLQVQIGSGSVTSSGYSSVGAQTGGGTQYLPTSVVTSGFVIYNQTGASASFSGQMILTLETSNTWVSGHNLIDAGVARVNSGAGTSGNLSGALDRVVITTVNGTDTFDAGSINILYE